jgi:hypothetical protein
MSGNDLAPRDASKQQSYYGDDPFASPATSIHTPSYAQSHAQLQFDPRPPPPAVVSAEINSRYDQPRQHSGHTDYKSGSVSSTGASSTMTPMSSFDIEKASIAQEQAPKRTSRESKRSGGSRDPEKAAHHNSWHGSRKTSQNANHTVRYQDDEEDEVDEGRRTQEDKAVQILLFLSGPCVVLSAMNTAWAIIALFITALSQPIRMCAKRPPFGTQLAGLLGPTLNLQFSCIYTPLPPHANEDGSYHNGMLLLVHLLSPFLSFAIMFAAWVLAFYWLASGMVGDPAGQDKRDDGKETVLGLRNFWERWLMRSVMEE